MTIPQAKRKNKERKREQRRHLNSSQKALVALEIIPQLAKEAEKRMLAGVKPDPTQKIEQGSSRKNERAAASQAASIVGTNRQYGSDVKKIKKEAPDLLPAISSGAMTIPQAKRKNKERKRVYSFSEIFSQKLLAPIAERWQIQRRSGVVHRS